MINGLVIQRTPILLDALNRSKVMVYITSVMTTYQRRFWVSAIRTGTNANRPVFLFLTALSMTIMKGGIKSIESIFITPSVSMSIGCNNQSTHVQLYSFGQTCLYRLGFSEYFTITQVILHHNYTEIGHDGGGFSFSPSIWFRRDLGCQSVPTSHRRRNDASGL